MVQPAAVREPVKFKPLLQSKIWGGDGLYRLLGKGVAADLDIGEAWELSDRVEAASLVTGGTFGGQNFHDLYAKHARDILGQQYTPTLSTFPLLCKFIFAREHLSVQVHPGPGSPLGEAKTECWYILEAPEGGELILGMASQGEREQILATLASKDCQNVLKRVAAKAGDLFFIPAGTVHAITAGILLYEVQQNSDTTFRLYDWGRVDSEGKARQLHLQEGRQVVDLRSHDQHRIPPILLHQSNHDQEFRVACPYFALVKYLHCQGSVALANENRFRILTCIRGSFEILWDQGQAIPIHLGDTVLVPASCANATVREMEMDSELLVSFVPLVEKEIWFPLRNGGFTDIEIRNLGGLEGLA